MSKTNALFHVVINTYCRRMTIPEEHKRELYKYIFGIIRQKNCELIRMNGIGNHIHMLINLHPTVAPANLMQNIKQSSSIWLKSNGNYPRFEGWGREYFAFSLAQQDSGSLVNYIVNQEAHHRGHSFEDEISEICKREAIEWNDNALT